MHYEPSFAEKLKLFLFPTWIESLLIVVFVSVNVATSYALSFSAQVGRARWIDANSSNEIFTSIEKIAEAKILSNIALLAVWAIIGAILYIALSVLYGVLRSGGNRVIESMTFVHPENSNELSKILYTVFDRVLFVIYAIGFFTVGKFTYGKLHNSLLDTGLDYFRGVGSVTIASLIVSGVLLALGIHIGVVLFRLMIGRRYIIYRKSNE